MKTAVDYMKEDLGYVCDDLRGMMDVRLSPNPVEGIILAFLSISAYALGIGLSIVLALSGHCRRLDLKHREALKAIKAKTPSR